MSNFFTSGGGTNDNGENKINFFAKPQPEKQEQEPKQEQKQEQPKKNSLDAQYNEVTSNYEQIFMEAASSIRRELDGFKPQDACTYCAKHDCNIEKKDIFSPYPPTGCKLREWQMQAITYLTGDYKNKLNSDYKAIMDKKSNYECNKCGACCKLAVSEYSYIQLKQRAMRGDKFSEEFVSVYVPIESEEEAKAIDPEYFELLNVLVQEDKIYYYRCTKLGEDNLCTIYEDRPNICKDFPHNPLKLLPSKCSFNEWKNEITHSAMLLKAKTDIINFYKEKLG